MYDCGALCTEDSNECSESVETMVKTVLEAVADVAATATGELEVLAIINDGGTDVAASFKFPICSS